MKMFCKAMAVVLAAGMLLSMAACGSGSATRSTGTPASQSSAAPASSETAAPGSQEPASGKVPAAFPLVTEPATISVFANNDDGVDLSKNWFTEVYEELTGVTIEWRMTNSDQYIEKLNLMLAGGDEVDIISTGNKKLEKVQVYKYGTQGVLLPINSFFDKYESFYYNNVLSQDDVWRENVTAPNGDIYGFNDVGSCFHCNHPYKMWVNQKWMDNLGIKNPTTPDEFADMLRRFRDEDANGNGDPNDEVPMSTCTVKTGASSNLEIYLMNAFQYANYAAKLLYVEDGKAVVSYTTEDWKKGLEYMNMLYSEGLIDTEAYIQDRTTMKNRNESGDVRVFGAVPAQHTGVLTTTGTTESWKEYIALPPLTGPDGLCTTTNSSLLNYDNFRTMISGTSKNPELAFRLCDGLYESEELGLMAGYGQEGVAWEWAADGEMGKDGLQARYTQLVVGNLPETDPYYKNYRWGSMFTGFPNNHSKWTSGQSIDDPLDTYYERYLYLNTEPYAAVKRDAEGTMPSFFFSEDDNAEIARLQTDQMNYVDEMTAAFITGIRSLDTEWEPYLKELDNLGLNRYLEIYQQYLDAYNA
ncbi:extracellular solute-binding protein [Ruminococcaceae bacterium OttesenSCG-928-L11]|nr:extracellular solute-binding protein [Ruminococcaceae bacterium OttesenSCG-928-L11]